MENKNNLLEVRNLKQYFNIPVGLLKSKPLKAVDDISFSIRKGETLGLVGESGCGKTTVGRSILQLYKPTSGEIIFNGKKIESKESIKYLRQNAQMVFQDPYSSLNPRMTVGDKVKEVRASKRLKTHPVCLATEGEVSIEMEKVLKAMPIADKPADIHAEKILEINTSHQIYERLKDAYANDREKLKKYSNVLFNQALLIEGLTIDDPVQYANDVYELI
jgi:ABC-type dipeptide/oligopeptide/nickel transport system ATPase subunit